MLSRFANPARFMRLSRWLAPLLAGIGAPILLWALYQGVFVVPADVRQGGDIMRIMFIHVPMAWLAMGSYMSIVVASLVWYIWRHELADVAARSIAPLSLVFTGLCLFTGAIWGKPTWGTYWQWGDARLVSVLVLFFMLVGYIAIRGQFDDPKKSAQAGAIIALLGGINLPIIKFSVDAVTTLHQPASVMTLEGPKMAAVYLTPLLLAAFGFSLLFASLTMTAMRTEIRRTQLRRLRLSALEARDV